MHHACIWQTTAVLHVLFLGIMCMEISVVRGFKMTGLLSGRGRWTYTDSAKRLRRTAQLSVCAIRVRVQLIRDFKTCTTDMYLQTECAHFGL